MTISLNGSLRKIGRSHIPFVIAEMSGNHNNSLERALAIVDAAANAGAHALKIQTYTADSMTLNLKHGEFFIDDPKSPWKGKSLYELYEEASTPLEWHGPIFERCAQKGLVFLSTPFDAKAVDFLEQFNPPIYKIASFENTDLPLIKKVAKTGKPILISTGMATATEIELAVKTARENGCKDLVLLKCTSSYPSTPKESNLLTIPHMRDLFGVEMGLSDHTMGVGVACASVVLGATVIEKHFTLRRADGGVDSTFSLEPSEFESLVIETTRSWESLGQVSYGPTDIEKKSLVYRRSIYVAEDIQVGDILTQENIRCIRPGLGMSPAHYEFLLGKKVSQNLKKGTPMKLEFLFNE